MIIQPIPPNSPSFGYSNQLKTLYRQGKLPVRYGFYGGTKKSEQSCMQVPKRGLTIFYVSDIILV